MHAAAAAQAKLMLPVDNRSYPKERQQDVNGKTSGRRCSEPGKGVAAGWTLPVTRQTTIAGEHDVPEA